VSSLDPLLTSPPLMSCPSSSRPRRRARVPHLPPPLLVPEALTSHRREPRRGHKGWCGLWWGLKEGHPRVAAPCGCNLNPLIQLAVRSMSTQAGSMSTLWLDPCPLRQERLDPWPLRSPVAAVVGDSARVFLPYCSWSIFVLALIYGASVDIFLYIGYPVRWFRRRYPIRHCQFKAHVISSAC